MHRPRNRGLKWVSSQSEFGKSDRVMVGSVPREAAKHHAPDATRRRRHFGRDRSDRNAGRKFGREAKDPGRDRREGDRGHAMRSGKIERRAR